MSSGQATITKQESGIRYQVIRTQGVRSQDGAALRRAWVPAAVASLLVYTVITGIIGRDVLAHVGSTIANDPGDPLLTAAILKWNATHVPFTDAWYQFDVQPHMVESLQADIADDVSDLFEQVLSDDEIQAIIDHIAGAVAKGKH